MKILSLTMVILTLCSCAAYQPKPFSKDTHCSPEAVLHIKNYPVTVGSEKLNEAVDGLAKSCYRAQFIAKEYAICTVVQTDQKGKISFLDIEDQTTKLPADLHQCLSDAIEHGDYSTFPNMTIMQPVFFHVKRRD
ncbi:MAG: hypothetical protein H7177_04175 [Rhizobacter sp.]|nr:hypothetical protein [Bacteriovorax sp.]